MNDMQEASLVVAFGKSIQKDGASLESGRLSDDKWPNCVTATHCSCIQILYLFLLVLLVYIRQMNDGLHTAKQKSHIALSMSTLKDAEAYIKISWLGGS